MSKYYPAVMHNYTRALSEVRYPITKEELIRQVGGKKVQVDFDQFILMKDILTDLPLERFTCAAELFNNIICARWTW